MTSVSDTPNRVGITVFRGSEPDVLDRMYRAGAAVDANVIVHSVRSS